MRRASCVLFVVVLTVPVFARAEVPLKSKAQLQAGATHIVIGKVETIYSVMSKSDDWVDTKSVAEIAVQKVEKGDRIQTGDLVYGRFWNKRWIGKGNPDPFSAGHIGPETGQLVRVYLVRKGGGYDVILPNGFEKSPKQATLVEALEDWIVLLEKDDIDTAQKRWANVSLKKWWGNVRACHKEYDYRKWLDGARHIGDATEFKVGGHIYGHMHVDWKKTERGWRIAEVFMCR